MTDDLLDAVRDLPKVLPVPARPGPERLRRGAEADEAAATRSSYYRDMLARMPRDDARASRSRSDFIVGFCGETEESFQKTMRPGRASARFKNSFIFKYSPRPGTKADDLYRRRRARGGQEAAQQRPAGVQNAISLEDNRAVRRPDGRGPGRRPEQVGGPARGTDGVGADAVDRPDDLRPDRRLRGHRAA